MTDTACTVCGLSSLYSGHHDERLKNFHEFSAPPWVAVLEDVGDRLGELAQAIAVRIGGVGEVGVRRLVVSDSLGLHLNVTPGNPTRIMTSVGVVEVVAESSDELTAFRDRVRLIEAMKESLDRAAAENDIPGDPTELARRVTAGDPVPLHVVYALAKQVIRDHQHTLLLKTRVAVLEAELKRRKT